VKRPTYAGLSIRARTAEWDQPGVHRRDVPALGAGTPSAFSSLAIPATDFPLA
jgi:hypothetical protein